MFDRKYHKVRNKQLDQILENIAKLFNNLACYFQALHGRQHFKISLLQNLSLKTNDGDIRQLKSGACAI